jgi:hypothetical protein
MSFDPIEQPLGVVEQPAKDLAGDLARQSALTSPQYLSKRTDPFARRIRTASLLGKGRIQPSTQLGDGTGAPRFQRPIEAIPTIRVFDIKESRRLARKHGASSARRSKGRVCRPA